MSNYSNIYSYDLITGKARAISCKGRLFSPAISPDQRAVVAAIESDRQMKSGIVLIDIENGSIIKKIAAGDNYSLRELDWVDDENIVTVGDKEYENTRRP